jgi:beta-galactosidase GanA
MPDQPRASLDFFPMGHCHHADFLKQSPPLSTQDHKTFMRGELERMKSAGFNVYNMEFGWLDLEIKPDVWDFGRTDAVFELCEELDLPIFAWLFAELTPRWLIRDDPSTAAVAATGYRSPTHSFGSHKARERIRRFIHAIIHRYGDSPRIIGYNVGVESGLFWIEEQDSSEPAARLWDYNPEVVAGFAPWLERKYGTIDELNRIYRDHYERFDDVEPPNSRFIHEQFMLINQVPWLDWRLYMIDVLTDYVHFKARVVRELKPGVLISDQSCSIDPAMNAQNIWDINTEMDVIGTSMFYSNAPGEYIQADYWEDYFRSAAKKKPYWLWELRCGQNAWGLTNWGLPISAADEGRFTWQAIGQNVKSIQYWNWRPHIGGVEVGGHGFTERDGTLTDRVIRIGKLCQSINRRAEWFEAARMPKAQIAMLDSILSRIIAAGEGSDQLVVDSQIGAYGLFKSQGYYMDVVNEDEIVAGALADYRLLVVPFAYAMRAETAVAIKAWVGTGGYLFSGIWCGAKDEHGFGQFKVPGFGLDEVFGAYEIKLTPVYGEQDRLQTNMGMSFDWQITGRPQFEIVAPLYAAGSAQVEDVFAGYRHVSSLKPGSGADVIAVDDRGEVVVVRNHYGQGQALMVGSFPIPEEAFAQTGLTRLAQDFVTLAGVTRPARILNRMDQEVEAKLLVGPENDGLLILLNVEAEDFPFNVRLEHRRLVSATEFERGEAVSFQVEDDCTYVQATVGAGDAMAIHFKEA